jgi:hypothetical protein
MAKFLTGNELNSELGKIFEEAEEKLILISPFMRLHVHYESILRTKKDNPSLEIIIVFGKNEENPALSMRSEELNFFQDFPNIEIRYERRLHAKYYANEKSAILTSMNLHRHSQDNNIEAGVMTQTRLFGGLAKVVGDEVDIQAFDYFYRVIDQSELIYKTVPEYDKGIMGSGLNKKFIKSNVTENKISDFFGAASKQKAPINKDKLANNKLIENKIQETDNNNGFCIRTGRRIPFNPKHPMCDEAYKSWAKYGKKDFPENFCHFSGEPSNGETSYSKPILPKNWKKASAR